MNKLFSIYIFLTALAFAACGSGDTLKVRAGSNNSTGSQGGSGASVVVAAQSREGAQSESSAKIVPGENVRFELEIIERGEYQICVRSPDLSTVSKLSDESTQLATIESTGCFAVELHDGVYHLDVSATE